MADRPYVWQMIKEAVENLGGKATYSQIKDYIRSKYGEVKEGTINCQIVVCTVNHPSRIYYPENGRPRAATSKYDFLFSTGRGVVELYDPGKHGTWEIRQDEYGKLTVFQSGLDEAGTGEAETGEIDNSFSFPIEGHLRDFIARNIESMEIDGQRLKLYHDENGREGIEYPTEVGPIDILAVNEQGDFVVFELKLSRGPDRACGQLLRYMGWVKAILAKDKNVKGIIVAKEVDNKLRYAASMCPSISLLEYNLNFILKPISLVVTY